MTFWMSIEVFNGPYAASFWADSHADSLVESALAGGAIDWDFKPTAWGVAFEIAFKTEAEWDAFRATDAFTSAMANAPEPKNGILIYRGRSLDGGPMAPKKKKPKSGSGSNALELPKFESVFEILPALFSDAGSDRRFLENAQ